MKPTQATIADLWCRLMHTAPMWPAHGQYECRTCGRRQRVCWEEIAQSPARAVLSPARNAGPPPLGTGNGIKNPMSARTGWS